MRLAGEPCLPSSKNAALHSVTCLAAFTQMLLCAALAHYWLNETVGVNTDPCV